MSKYTTELRYICENYAGLTDSKGYGDIDSIINQARPKLFDFDYPIFDQAYKAPLENKIISHYYMREIGMETVGLFKHYLRTRMREIMPYYNELYKTTLLEFNPLYDVNLFTTHKGKDSKDRQENITGNMNETKDVNKTKSNIKDINDKITKNYTQEKTNNSEITGDNSITTDNTSEAKETENYTENKIDKFHDTPQGNIDLINDSTYLTNARVINTESDKINNKDSKDHGVSIGTEKTNEEGKENIIQNETIDNVANENENENEEIKEKGEVNKSETTQEGINGTNEYIDHVYGKSSSSTYPKLINEFRESLLNIDMLVINELSDLFMLLWDSGI